MKIAIPSWCCFADFMLGSRLEKGYSYRKPDSSGFLNPIFLWASIWVPIHLAHYFKLGSTVQLMGDF